MDPAQVAVLMAQLGITGIDPTKMAAMMTIVQELGGGIEVNPEELNAYFPQVEKSFYLPTNIPKNFYYDADGLRSLSTVNSGVFRKLLGIR